MALKKSLKGLLAGILVGAGALMSSKGNAGTDMLSFDNSLIRNGDLTFEGSTIKMGRYGLASEGKDSYDRTYTSPGEGQWGPKVVTRLDGYDLSQDLRPTNSLSDYVFDLGVVIFNGQDVVGTNRLATQVSTNSFYKTYVPSNEHWTISYDIKTNYYMGGAARKDKKNVRDLCPVPNVLTNWNTGVSINIPASDTNSNGEVVFGSGVFHKELNQLSSSHSGNGSNSFEGTSTPLNYGSSTNVTLNADSGNYVDYYVLTTTDNTGTVSVVTNDLPGTSVTSTNIPINNIKGSNAIFAVYAPSSSGFTVDIQNGSKYNLNPTNFTGVSSGASVTTTAANVYSTNSPGVRTKIIGLEKKL